MHLPVSGGMVFRTSGTRPRTNALYCYPVSLAEWPADPEIVERVPLRSCVRRGAAIDLILDRSRENRSQLVFTKARPGRRLLAVPPDPQAGAPERPHPHRPRGGNPQPGDRGRQPRAVSVPLRRPAGHGCEAGTAVRRLRRRARRQATSRLVQTASRQRLGQAQATVTNSPKEESSLMNHPPVLMASL
jgi:hypothetical protein